MSNMLKAITSAPSDWVKRTMAGMTMDEKLGQLMVSRSFIPDLEESISKGIIGNILVRNDTSPERIRELQSMAKIPMIISADLEVGTVYKMNAWPAPMVLGAIGEEETAYQWAYCQGPEARANGINAVYGPVLDVAMNPDSVMTGSRALSGDAKEVARLGTAVVRGYQDAGVLPYAKHFPGFGRGWEDTHREMSNCDADKKTLYEVSLSRFFGAV